MRKLFEMRKLCLFSIYLLAMWVTLDEAHEQTDKQILLTCCYETLCMGSRDFISNKLPWIYGNFTNQLIYKLIPFGDSQATKDQNGRWSFTCQHGPQECLGNRIQACGLHVLKGNPGQQVKFVSEFMKQIPPFEDYGQYFPYKGKNKFLSCINSTKGDELLLKNSNLTTEAEPDHIPQILINNKKPNSTVGNQLREDPVTYLCQFFYEMSKPCDEYCHQNTTGSIVSSTIPWP